MEMFLYLALLLAVAPGPQSAEPLHLTPADLGSDHMIQKIVHVEELQGFADGTVYVRSVVGSRTYSDRSLDEPVQLFTFLHGLYHQEGDQWLPLWEEIGSYDDGIYEDCADGYRGSLNGGFVVCHFTTHYLELPGRPARAFCIQNDWIPYRYRNRTLRCFEPGRASRPVLHTTLPSPHEMGITADGALRFRGYSSEGEYVAEFVWDPEQEAFVRTSSEVLER